MSPDHQVSERVYSALKSDLLDSEQFALWLPIARLEVRYHTSATPIREALLRLVGEGLVILNPSGGFSMPRLTAHHVRDLYELNMQILLAAASWPRETGSKMQIGASSVTAKPSAEDLFLAIGSATRNAAMISLIESQNDKLRRIRRAETRKSDHSERELGTIERPFRQGETAKLRRALIAYHRRRIQNSPAIAARSLATAETSRA